MSTATYAKLSKAQLSYEYLHTNSTTHEFLFGALAEIVDNSRDANATKLSIFTLYDEDQRAGYMLCFLDDGEGMLPNEAADIITFGRSSKHVLDESLIGMYGNGLKSGSMRIGNDLMVFTKRKGTQTCLFISRTFHEEESIEEVIVPIPSFHAGTQNPLDDSEELQEKMAMEMDVILRYSPFKTEEDFFAQFDRIDGDSGTLVIVFNMKLLDSGDPELDILTDTNDILLTNPESDFDSDDGLMLEKKSFRAYVAILYMDPRMKVYIQGKKVRTKKLAAGLYKPKMYKYSSNRFKTRSEHDARKSQDDARISEHKAKEAQSKAKALENKGGSSKAYLAELRKANQLAAELKRETQLKKEHSNRKVKSLKDPKMLNLIFGINIENRAHDGVFVYNCSRLIKMYERVGPQNDGGVFCSGVLGVVNVPYLVLEPTHNKQDFADAKEYRHLMKAMGEHMVQYWKDLNIAQQGVLKFWESFGYISQKWKDAPSDDSKFTRKRAMQLNVTLQCDMCLKWRTLPFSSSNIGKEFTDEWTCNLNPDTQHNKCTTAEQRMNLPESILKKEQKSQDQKSRDLEEEIRKKQDMLHKMHKNRVVSSSRELQEMDRKKALEERRKREVEEERQRMNEEEEREQREAERREREMTEKKRKKEAEEKQKKKEKEAEEKRTRKEAEERERQRRKEKDAKDKQKRKEQEEKQRKKEEEQEERRRLKEEQEEERQRLREEQEEERQRKKEEQDDERQRRKEDEEERRQEAAEQRKLAAEEKKRVAEEKRQESEERRATSSSSRSAMSAATRTKETTKRRAPSPVEDEDTGETEESDVDMPVKRSRASKSATSTTKEESPEPRRRGRSSGIANGNTSARGRRGQSAETSEEETSAFDFANSIEMDESQSEADMSATEADSNAGDVGTKVEALVNKKWYSGTVVRVNAKDGKWKVKFDYNKRDKYDKWIDKNSSTIRIAGEDSTLDTSLQSPTSVSSQDTANEAPSSSTAAIEGLDTSAVSEEIATGYRTCLRYFLPPQWTMDKDSISAMSFNELSSFPLDDFFDHYEKGLRKLVNNFQTEASLRKQDAEAASSKLANVRKMIAKLLTSSNEEFNIDPECDGEQVDEFLAACLQASSGKGDEETKDGEET